MGMEVSTYVNAIVGELQAAYGERWNIAKRGESTASVSGKPWGVQIGYSSFVLHDRGDAGLDMDLTCAATVFYTGVGPTHNDGFQVADIAASLAAWLSGHVVEGTQGRNIEMHPEPLTQMRGAVEVPTGQYAVHVFWEVKLDDIDPDIDIPGYETSHPIRPLSLYYFEIELADGTRRVVTAPRDIDLDKLLPDNGVAVRRVVIADPQSMPRDDGENVYYPALLELGG